MNEHLFLSLTGSDIEGIDLFTCPETCERYFIMVAPANKFKVFESTLKIITERIDMWENSHAVMDSRGGYGSLYLVMRWRRQRLLLPLCGMFFCFWVTFKEEMPTCEILAY